MTRKVWFVGTEEEVAHQAAPLTRGLSFQLNVVAPEEVVDVADEGDLAVFFSEHFDRFRSAVVGLREKRVGTLYLVDGILEWRNAWENRDDEPACPFTMRPVLCDKVASIGPSQSRILQSWGNGSRVETVGIPRLDALRKSWRETGFGEFKGDKVKCLVTTAKTPGFTPEQIRTTAQSLNSLKEFFEGSPVVGGKRVEVLWRLTSDLADELGVENQLNDFAGDDVQQAIERCDAVITTPSTTMLEAMLLRRPVALLDFHHCPTFVPAVWNITSEGSIGSTVESLLNPAAEKLVLQDAFLCDAMQVVQPAVDRFEQLVTAMFNAIDAQADSVGQLKFEQNLLVPTSHVIESFVHEKVFDQYAEFGQQDLVELQAELAHARREVEHQKRIAEGLREELGQAHQIFEQIHNHPIAGPVVRIRERMMEFLKRDQQPGESAPQSGAATD